jgi:PAS domain S-box-containing protein
MLPAPWATWWARSIYALLALAVLALLYRGHARRVAVAAQIQQTNEALRAEMARREEQQRALIIANEQAQRYLDVVEVIILSLDPDGGIRLVNQKGVGVLGYPEHELVGRNFYQTLVPPVERDAVRDQFAGVRDHAYSESPIVARDGSERLIAWHAVSLPATADQPGGLLISGMDLTQERSLERQVREAQKMEALGTLSRGIAHDFNNILGAILGLTELVREEVAGHGRAAQYLRDLELSVDRARDLIKAILTFGRQAKQEAVPTLVQPLVQEALHLLRATVPPHIRIVTRCDDSVPPVLADPSQLHQLVMNLATNAVQAVADEGGTLTMIVAAQAISRETARGRSNLRPGPHVVLVVEDTGPGMDEVTKARMFEPFFTTKGPSRGTGLGLSVVHGLVTQMGGDIEVDSSVGRGTRISITLPACADDVPRPVVELPDTTVLPRGTETVLLVDDEPVLVEIGRAMLIPLGYRVFGATGGAEALRELERLGGADLIVTDQNMPGMTGLALARTVKSAYPHVPVILVSGAHDGSIDDPAFDAALDKPFKARDLARAVRAVLDRRS